MADTEYITTSGSNEEEEKSQLSYVPEGRNRISMDYFQPKCISFRFEGYLIQ